VKSQCQEPRLEEMMCSTQAIKWQWGSMLTDISYDSDHQLGGGMSAMGNAVFR